MIPKATPSTPETVALSAALSAAGPSLFGYPTLSGSHFRLHGRLIELFNSIEFNLRRSAEFLARSKLLGKFQKREDRLKPYELVPALHAALGEMDPGIENIAESRIWLNEIEEERSTRNVLAHWVARQIPSRDAIVYFSNDNFDGRQSTGSNIPNDHIQFLVLDVRYLRELDPFLVERDRWLGYKTTEWHKRYCS